MERARGAVVVWTLLWIAAGCGREGDSQVAPDAGPPRSATEATPAASAPVPSGIVAGEFVVSLVGGRVQLASREAPRLAILQRLADLEGFKLDPAGLPPREITLQLDEEPLGGALTALLADTSYRTAWRYDAAIGRPRLVSLAVGIGPSESSGRVARGSGEAAGRAERSVPRLTLPGAVRTGDDELDEEERRWLEALDSPNDRERREAIDEVDIDSPAGLTKVLELAREDPDALVRSSAVERLEDSGNFAAVQGLLAALNDPDPRVVLAAIEALEFAGDESVVPYLMSLLDHADPRVREAAREAIDFLS